MLAVQLEQFMDTLARAYSRTKTSLPGAVIGGRVGVAHT